MARASHERTPVRAGSTHGTRVHSQSSPQSRVAATLRRVFHFETPPETPPRGGSYSRRSVRMDIATCSMDRGQGRQQRLQRVGLGLADGAAMNHGDGLGAAPSLADERQRVLAAVEDLDGGPPTGPVIFRRMQERATENGEAERDPKPVRTRATRASCIPPCTAWRPAGWSTPRGSRTPRASGTAPTYLVPAPAAAATRRGSAESIPAPSTSGYYAAQRGRGRRRDSRWLPRKPADNHH